MEVKMPSSEEDASPELLEKYKQWLALGEGGIAYNWEGFMICKHFEKTMARNDTTDSSLYDSPQVHAPGWGEATEKQRRAAQTSFLSHPLPERDSPRARAKPFIFPQRERNENEEQMQKLEPHINPLSLASAKSTTISIGRLLSSNDTALRCFYKTVSFP